MVEYNSSLDNIFDALGDATRRDILRRVAEEELAVSELATHYKMSLAAVSKHLKVLEAAGLIKKRLQGKQHYISLRKRPLNQAETYLRQFEHILSRKLSRNS